MKKFQKNNLNKKDHERVDKGAKAVKKNNRCGWYSRNVCSCGRKICIQD